MPSVMTTYDASPDMLALVLSSIDTPAVQFAVREAISFFLEAGLVVKIKHLFPDTPNAYFRILCFIKKSAEALIINTRTDRGREGVTDGVNFQLRILNPETFARLNELSPSILRQILSANDCRFCSSKCEGKRYVFSYDGKEYVKCQYLCSNFRFTIEEEAEADSLLDLIRREIEYKPQKKGTARR